MRSARSAENIKNGIRQGIPYWSVSDDTWNFGQSGRNTARWYANNKRISAQKSSNSVCIGLYPSRLPNFEAASISLNNRIIIWWAALMLQLIIPLIWLFSQATLISYIKNKSFIKTIFSEYQKIFKAIA